MGFLEWLSDFFRPKERIHPYYEDSLPETATFLSGEAIARNWGRLNSAAENQGLRPFSLLRFSPVPIVKDTLQWNTAEEGLGVLSDQLELVKLNPDSFLENELLVTEIERIILALRLAKSKRIRFTLVRSFGEYTNRLMWEAGGGSV